MKTKEQQCRKKKSFLTFCLGSCPLYETALGWRITVESIMTLFCDPRFQTSHSGTDKAAPCFTLHYSNFVIVFVHDNQSAAGLRQHRLLFPSHLHDGGSQVITLSLFDCLQSASCPTDESWNIFKNTIKKCGCWELKHLHFTKTANK